MQWLISLTLKHVLHFTFRANSQTWVLVIPFFCWSSLVDGDLSFFPPFFMKLLVIESPYEVTPLFSTVINSLNSKKLCLLTLEIPVGFSFTAPSFSVNWHTPFWKKTPKYFKTVAKEVRRRRQHSPPLAGYNSHFLAVPLQSDPPRLPPLIIWGIDDVKDVSILETEPLAWEATVFALVIVKHGSVKGNKEMKAGG